MLGIYFSGTGNTKHCIEKLIHLLDENTQAISIEKEDAANELSTNHEGLSQPVMKMGAGSCMGSW